LKGRARTQYEHIPMEEMESKEVAEILGTLPRAKRAGGARAQQSTGKFSLREVHGRYKSKNGTGGTVKTAWLFLEIFQILLH